MLNDNDLKHWLHRNLNQGDKLILVLSAFAEPCKIDDIRKRAFGAGFKIPQNWNPSAILARARKSGLVIGTPEGWEITEAGKQHLRNLGVTKISAAAVRVATARMETARNRFFTGVLDLGEIRTI